MLTINTLDVFHGSTFGCPFYNGGRPTENGKLENDRLNSRTGKMTGLDVVRR